MSTNITGSTNVMVDLKNENALDLTTTIDQLNVNALFALTFGTAANKINILYHDSVVLADGANTTLNLYDSGTLLDAFGAALTLSALKILFIQNNSADANLLLFGGASADLPICSSNTDQIIIRPGAAFVWTDLSAAGTVITTNKNLRLEHDGTGTSTMAITVIAGGLD